MKTLLAGNDFSLDLLRKINPGILLPENWTNFQTPSQYTDSDLAVQRFILDARDDISAGIASLYGSVNIINELYVTGKAISQPIRMVNNNQGNLTYQYPGLLDQDPIGLINDLQRNRNSFTEQSFQVIDGQSAITFYVMNINLEVDTGIVSPNSQFFVAVFNYLLA